MDFSQTNIIPINSFYEACKVLVHYLLIVNKYGYNLWTLYLIESDKTWHKSFRKQHPYVSLLSGYLLYSF